MLYFNYQPSLFFDYSLLAIFLLISTIIALIVLALSSLLSEKQIDLEKLSAYECGFDRAPSKFNYRKSILIL
jgi:NADH:ubiquinone oxidoreductase subunit 3 (subunit A)